MVIARFSVFIEQVDKIDDGNGIAFTKFFEYLVFGEIDVWVHKGHPFGDLGYVVFYHNLLGFTICKGGEALREYLKKLRQDMRMSQQAVADKMGVYQSYYNMIETGERQADMNLSIMRKLAAVFGVSMEYILEEENKLHETKVG